MGETIKTQAIVLAKVDYRDNDRILTLFSPEYGRMTATARGVKKQTSKLRPSGEIFAFGTYLLAETHGRYTVTGYDSVDSFHELREDFDRLSTGALLLKITEKSVEEGESDPELFTLLLRSLDKLRDEKTPPALTVSAFLMKFCASAGYCPELDVCAKCGKKEELLFLSPALGGVLCTACCEGEHQAVTGGCLYYLRKLVNEPWENAFLLKPTEKQLRELYRVCCFYTAFFFDEKIKIMEYIEKYGLI